MVLAAVWAVALQGAGVASASSADEISIDAAHFPDGIFREFVKTLDKDGNGSLSPQERDAVTVMEFISGYQEMYALSDFLIMVFVMVSEAVT